MNSIRELGSNDFHKPGLFTLVLLLLAAMPWLHGAELDWEVMLFSALFMLTLALVLISKQVNVITAFVNVRLPLCLLILWFGYCCLFLIPLPVEIVQWLSPNLAATQHGSHSNMTLTISKALTLVELAKIASVICVFCLCYLFAQGKAQQNKILNILFYSSAVMAIYSQLNHYTNGQFELMSAIPPFDSPWDKMVRGTFSYKNQYSIYLAITISIGFGLLIDKFKKEHEKLALNNATAFIMHIVTSKHIITLLLLMMMLLSFVGTNSRGGSLILAVATIITLLNYFVRSKKRNWSKNKTLIVLGIVVLFTSLFITSKSYERFETLGLQDNGRILLHTTALSIFKDYAIVGTGPGTYSAIQHSYKDNGLGNTAMSKHAHNDYLELLATQGGLGAILFALPLLLMLGSIFAHLPVNRIGTQLGCQVGIVCLLLHSSIDFNFATLTLSVYFFVIFTVLLRMTEEEKISRQRYGE
jgi:O-antigen ligase